MSSYLDGRCTGEWLVANRTNGFPDPLRCKHPQQQCTYGGNCASSIDGSCPVKNNTKLANRGDCTDPALDQCDGMLAPHNE